MHHHREKGSKPLRQLSCLKYSCHTPGCSRLLFALVFHQPPWFQLQPASEAHIPAPVQALPFLCSISRLYWIPLARCFQSSYCPGTHMLFSVYLLAQQHRGRRQGQVSSCTRVQLDPHLLLLYWHYIYEESKVWYSLSRLHHPDKATKQVILPSCTKSPNQNFKKLKCKVPCSGL